LGVEYAVVRERIARWVPASLRGELKEIGRKQVYVDCYNANPASMSDTLGIFSAIAPTEQPRWLILGGMEELGEHAARYHRDLGRGLTLRSVDRVSMIGDHAAEMKAGALEAGISAGQINVCEDVESLRAAFATFEGAVLLKGSRRYHLETLLPENNLEASHA